MTAHVMREEREKIKRAGMNDYISKPFNVRQIIAILNRYLKRPYEASTIVPEAESARQTTLPELKNLDCTKAIERLDGDKALYFSVLKMFLDGHADADEVITKALNGYETKSALRIIHTVIGNAGSIGAYKLSDSARLLEKAIQETSSDVNIDSLLKEFSTELKQVIHDLKSVSFSELDAQQ
jgi:HPt (histidine-containing phosphotransfer) domain-containing protein